MDPQLTERLVTLEKKTDAVYASVEKIRKYFLWTLIITVAMILLPLVGLIFALPSFFSFYGDINSQVQSIGGL